MGMKPIASRALGWCMVPYSLALQDDGSVRAVGDGGVWGKFTLRGLTFAQFLDQYNRCTDSIYFID